MIIIHDFLSFEAYMLNKTKHDEDGRSYHPSRLNYYLNEKQHYTDQEFYYLNVRHHDDSYLDIVLGIKHDD